MTRRSGGMWRGRGVRLAATIVAAIGAGVVGLPAATAGATTTPSPLVIGVDHLDPANQQPQNGRLIEYTDFFSRDFTVAKGQTVSFNFLGVHSVALTKNRATGLATYPVAFPDDENSVTGGPQAALGPAFNPVQGGDTTNSPQGTQFGAPGPSCGLPNQPVCTFTGGTDFENSGVSTGFNGPWNVQINANPGTYAVYCTIHPGMTAALHVAKPGQPTTSQLDVRRASQKQFVTERAQAREAESDANNANNVTGTPGHRVFTEKVGISAAGGKVTIDEMLPHRQLNLVAGDKVNYVWTDPHNIHSVKFPDDPNTDPPPFAFDCGTGYGGPPGCTESDGDQATVVTDPGTTPPGQPLTTLTAVADSGLLLGSGYGVPQAHNWSVTTNSATTKGVHTFHCTLHDFMSGSVNVS